MEKAVKKTRRRKNQEKQHIGNRHIRTDRKGGKFDGEGC